jgi:hypothetical protein
VLGINALVINTGDKLVLFDTGMGGLKLFGPTTGKLCFDGAIAGWVTRGNAPTCSRFSRTRPSSDAPSRPVRDTMKSIGQGNKSIGRRLRAALPDLDRGAWHRAVGTEYAAIAWLRLEAFPTALAVVKESAGVLRHYFGLLVLAPGARNGGFRDHLSLAAASSRVSRAGCARAQRSPERWTRRMRG